jgi:1-phosphatidylinositol-4-phosphate 5-kinase
MTDTFASNTTTVNKQPIIFPTSTEIFFNKISHKFTDFSSNAFCKIRKLSNIENEQYIDSFKTTTMPEFSAEGRSGVFKYYSGDFKYIIKSTSVKEFEKILSIIPDYLMYLESEDKLGHKSFLCRVFGAHRVIMYDIPLYFVVMLNIFPPKGVNEV